jgi:myo-inositol-1-phosphate synthase
MSTIHFRSLANDEAESAGLETGDLLILYNDVKDYARQNADAIEALLDGVAVAYEEDVAEGITDEIGMRVLAAIGDHAKKLFDNLEDVENPFEDEEQIYHQKAVAAALLDTLVEFQVIKLPEEEAGSDDDDHEGGSEQSESE